MCRAELRGRKADAIEFCCAGSTALELAGGERGIPTETLIADLSDTLSAHPDKEERILFPMIRNLEDPAAALDFHCGTVKNPVEQMERA